MRKINLIFLISLLVIIKGFGQNITNVDFDVRDSIIIVNYDIIDYNDKDEFDISLKFEDENGNKYSPKSITGDISRIYGGRKKQIMWNVLADNSNISVSFQAIVKIAKMYKYKEKIFKNKKDIKGGPSNAFLSLLVPGLGDSYVNDNWQKSKIQPYYVGLLSYGFIIAGIAEKITSDKAYTNYHNSTDQTNIDTYYTNANDAHHAFIICTALGATIWTADILYVFFKGFQNRHEQLKYYSKNPLKNIGFTYNANAFQMKYVIKF